MLRIGWRGVPIYHPPRLVWSMSGQIRSTTRAITVDLLIGSGGPSLPTTIDNLELRGHLARSLLEPLGCFHPIMVRFPHRTTTHFHGRCELRLTTTRRVDSDGGSRVNVLVVKASCRTSIAGRRRTVLRRASSKIGVRLHNFFAVARRRCGCGGIQHGCSSRMLPTNPSTIR